jgi:mono/diheme cytochrome c family protein
MLGSGIAAAQAVPRGDALNGRKIYVSYGCYQCHGYQGQGSNAGSRLAPGPAPYPAFAYQVRQPRVRMPAYSLKIVSDQEVADIYAYLLTIPKARSVAEIPLLSGTPSKDEASK